MHNGKLTVVGAGPGDLELITLKGIKALECADVVLYDALVDPALLEYAPNAEHIFVGKRKGCYRYQQEQINELIVQRASQGVHVVRLKGGDPFVFGRGAEEMEFAANHGIEVAVVPGISSAWPPEPLFSGKNRGSFKIHKKPALSLSSPPEGSPVGPASLRFL